jgi:protein TonB
MTRFTIALLVALVCTPRLGGAQQSDSSIQTYQAFQLDREARLKAGNPPSYPAQLRQAGMPGDVLVQYVIDEKGRPVMDTFKVLRSSNAHFTEAVRRAVAAMVFHPAQAQGRAVRQMVQQPFHFKAS